MSGYTILNIYSLVLLLTLIIIFLKKERVHRIEDNTYSYLLTTMFITSIIGLINILLVNSNYSNISNFYKLFGKLYLMSLFMVYYYFLFYTLAITKKYQKRH